MANDANVRDVEQLALFGRNIKSLGENMYSTMQVAQQRMNAVCEGWHDDHNEKFRELFNQSVQDVKRMSEQFAEYADFIARITNYLQEYKNMRI